MEGLYFQWWREIGFLEREANLGTFFSRFLAFRDPTLIDILIDKSTWTQRWGMGFNDVALLY